MGRRVTPPSFYNDTHIFYLQCTIVLFTLKESSTIHHILLERSVYMYAFFDIMESDVGPFQGSTLFYL